MHIGIIGLNVNNKELNYGTILHTWSFVRFLNKTSIIEDSDVVEIINYYPDHSKGLVGRYPIFCYLLKLDFREAIKSFLCLREHRCRYDNFRVFINHNFILSSPYNSKTIEEHNLLYDFLIVESDTVWNKLGGKFDKAYFLNCQSMRNSKKIAYSVDIGPLKPTEQDLIVMHDMLDSLECISCRGDHAASLISDCVNREIPNLIDPTLLLKKEDYDSIANPRIFDSSYIVLYMVGYDEKLYKSAYSYAKKKNLPVVELYSLMTFRTLKTFNRKTYSYGVEDFLSAIKYSECVFTNSFHGICISLVYEKKFYVFQRTGNKISDLCNSVGLANRIIDNDMVNDEEIDYDNLNNIINEQINISREWLFNAIRKTNGN